MQCLAFWGGTEGPGFASRSLSPVVQQQEKRPDPAVQALGSRSPEELPGVAHASKTRRFEFRALFIPLPALVGWEVGCAGASVPLRGAAPVRSCFPKDLQTYKKYLFF